MSDADTALLYMQQRYYEPIAGRFLSVDPVTTDAKTGEHFNRYVYAENNPYKYADPDGQLPILLVPLALKALDAALTAADLYTAAQTGGAGAVGRVALESLAGNALPGGKILGRLVHGIGDASLAAKETSRALSEIRYTQAGEKFYRYESANPAFSRVTPRGGVSPGTYAAPVSDGLVPVGQRISTYNLPSPNIARPNSVLLEPPAGTPIIGPRSVFGGTGNEVIFPSGF